MKFNFKGIINCFLLAFFCFPAYSQSLVQYSDTVGPLIYAHTQIDGEYGFIGIPNHQLEAQLIPNIERQEELGIHIIDSIIGVTHFFLDMDLTSGFVHRYTRNMFNRLRSSDFVMKFERKANDSLVGTVSYLYKKDMKPDDSLGQNIALFRQWKLSEIDWKKENQEVMVQIKNCKYATFCGCPQVKAGCDNPFKAEIPIWSETNEVGYLPLSKLNLLGEFNGGTVVIIWETIVDGKPKIMFQDIHGSLNLIITTAIQVAKDYDVDPHIAISDAGPFARKIRSDNNKLNCAIIRRLALPGARFGAGFGYLPGQ